MNDRQVVTRFKEPKKAKPQKRRQNWSAQCDIYMGRIVRSRGRCESCGSTEVIQWAHGFSRRYRNVRWDERNSFALCAKEHWKWTHDPLGWDDWLRARWGEDLYAELRALALSDDKSVKPNVKTLAVELKARWEAIERRIGGAA